MSESNRKFTHILHYALVMINRIYIGVARVKQQSKFQHSLPSSQVFRNWCIDLICYRLRTSRTEYDGMGIFWACLSGHEGHTSCPLDRTGGNLPLTGWGVPPWQDRGTPYLFPPPAGHGVPLERTSGTPALPHSAPVDILRHGSLPLMVTQEDFLVFFLF